LGTVKDKPGVLTLRFVVDSSKRRIGKKSFLTKKLLAFFFFV